MSGGGGQRQGRGRTRSNELRGRTRKHQSGDIWAKTKPRKESFGERQTLPCEASSEDGGTGDELGGKSESKAENGWRGHKVKLEEKGAAQKRKEQADRKP